VSAIAWNAVRDGNGITVRHQWNAHRGRLCRFFVCQCEPWPREESACCAGAAWRLPMGSMEAQARATTLHRRTAGLPKEANASPLHSGALSVQSESTPKNQKRTNVLTRAPGRPARQPGTQRRQASAHAEGYVCNEAKTPSRAAASEGFWWGDFSFQPVHIFRNTDAQGDKKGA